MTSIPPPPQQSAWGTPKPYAYGAGRPPMQSLRGLAVAMLVLLPIAGLAALLSSVAFFQRANLLDRFLDGELGFSQAVRDGERADDFVFGSVGFYVFALIATAVVFIIWQWRHAKNAEALGVRGGLGPGMAIGGWFIPLANLLLPPMQIFQSSKGGDPQRRGPGIVVAWAIAFGLGAVLWFGGLAFFNEYDDDGYRVMDSVRSVEDRATGDRVAGAGMIITAIAAGIGAAMVHQVTARQTAAYKSDPPSSIGDPFGVPPSAPPPDGAAPPTVGAPIPGSYPAPQPQAPPPPPPSAPPPPPPPAPPPPDGGGPAWPAPPG